MLKNIFYGFIGIIVGMVLMSITVFVLQAQNRMDLLPFIMIAGILLLVCIFALEVWFYKMRHQKKAAAKTANKTADSAK